MKNEKSFLILVLVFFLLFFFNTYAFAQSEYVLPYPSRMPGSLLYKIHLIYENVSKYWYFGDFGQFGYNLKMADKYLVEARTLFEYKQYLLGYNALQKSDFYFMNIMPNLIKAEKNGKNPLKKKLVFNEASKKHIEVLKEMELETPDTFVWNPEKELLTTLNIQKTILNSILLREKNYE